MACTCNDFLGFAKTLAEQSSSLEIAHRSAVSRAYYAAFHAAKSFSDNLSVPGEPAPQGMGVHASLYHSLSHPRLPNGDPLSGKSRSIAYMSQNLKRHREVADYDLQAEVVASDAEDAIAKAKEILGKAKIEN